MSKTFVQPGQIITLTAPMGGVTPGQMLLIGSLFVISTNVAAAGDPFEASRAGAHDLPKAGGETFSEGDEVFYDPAASLLHNHDGSGLFAPVGGCIQDAASGDETVRLVLWGVPVPPVVLES